MDLRLVAVLLFGGWIILGFGPLRAWAAPTATVTTLAITSTGNPVSAVDSGSMVTLTATVKAGAAVVTTGQVKFCDGSVAYCTDIHLLGTRPLTSTGTAVLEFVPGIGSHSYKAVFLETTTDAASASSEAALTVTGTIPTAISIDRGNAGNYMLTATVTRSGSGVSRLGSASFVDTTTGSAVLWSGLYSLLSADVPRAVSTGPNPSPPPYKLRSCTAPMEQPKRCPDFGISSMPAISCPMPYLVNVLDFGCKGDGMTDDTACMVAAGNQVIVNSASGPVTLVFPKGRYMVNPLDGMSPYTPGATGAFLFYFPTQNNLTFVGQGATLALIPHRSSAHPSQPYNQQVNVRQGSIFYFWNFKTGGNNVRYALAFQRSLPSDLVDQSRIEGGSHADRLRKNCGSRRVGLTVQPLCL